MKMYEKIPQLTHPYTFRDSILLNSVIILEVSEIKAHQTIVYITSKVHSLILKIIKH